MKKLQLNRETLNKLTEQDSVNGGTYPTYTSPNASQGCQTAVNCTYACPTGNPTTWICVRGVTTFQDVQH